MALAVLLNIDCAPAPDAIAILHFFIEVFNADLRITFFKALLLLILTRFIADLIFGKTVLLSVNKSFVTQTTLIF